MSSKLIKMQKRHGLTLTEILITLTTIAIGAALVIPNMRSGIENRGGQASVKYATFNSSGRAAL